MRPWTQTPKGGEAQIGAISKAIPQIDTARLTLRLPKLSDWAVLEPIYTTERAAYIGGPMSSDDAWLDFNQLVAGWILRGHGALTICDKSDDTVLGLVLLGHEFGDPEPELGWLLTESAEGQGFATEAAAALTELGRDIYGDDGFVSYIAEDNAASRRVAEKIGGRMAGVHPLDATVAVYRYPYQGSVT